jgi:THO complex subunit 1
VLGVFNFKAVVTEKSGGIERVMEKAAVDKLAGILASCDEKEGAVLVEKSSPEDLAKVSEWYDETIAPEKSIRLELICKQLIHRLAQEENSMDKVCCLLDSVLHLSRESKCDYPLTHLLIEELLDIQTIEWCQNFWPYMISRESEIANNLAGNKAPGTTLIRLCNSLVRRLSKTQDAQFSGQIAMFLARAFPISEKSGLNIRGTFNTENVTTYEELVGSLDADGDEDVRDEDENASSQRAEEEANDVLYAKFWSIQSVFAEPTLVFNQEKLDDFKGKITEVIQVLKKRPRDGGGGNRGRFQKRKWRNGEAFSEAEDNNEDEDVFVPKWMTRRDLFELQLKDHNFRRTILTQIMIISHFLLSLTPEEKGKWPQQKAVNRGVMYSFTLSAVDKAYFENTLKTLGPGFSNSEHYHRFLATLTDIFNRERNWQIWKLQSCPSFESPKVDPTSFSDAEANLEKLKQPRKKYWHAMGTPGLTKAWKIKTGLDDLRDPERYKIPDAETYYNRIRELTGQKQQLGEEDKEKEQEIQDSMESITWRGLRAAREQGYWVQFGYVDKEKGFSGLFMTPEERIEYSNKHKRPSVANGHNANSDEARSAKRPRVDSQSEPAEPQPEPAQETEPNADSQPEESGPEPQNDATLSDDPQGHPETLTEPEPMAEDPIESKESSEQPQDPPTNPEESS